jgi:hypothetical protein
MSENICCSIISIIIYSIIIERFTSLWSPPSEFPPAVWLRNFIGTRATAVIVDEELKSPHAAVVVLYKMFTCWKCFSGWVSFGVCLVVPNAISTFVDTSHIVVFMIEWFTVWWIALILHDSVMLLENGRVVAIDLVVKLEDKTV